MTMRPMMLEVIFATARAGSGDSAAAMVTTSAPIMDQMTVVTAVSTLTRRMTRCRWAEGSVEGAGIAM